MIHTAETREKIAAIHRGRMVPKSQRIALTRRNLDFPGPKDSQHRYMPRPVLIRVPTGGDLRQFAGIVDCDGSIRFHGGRPFVAIYNSNERLMEWLKVQTGKRRNFTADLRG